MAITVEISLEEGVGQKRNELGQFTSEVERGCSAAASNAARSGAALARGIYAGSGYGWDCQFQEGGGGGHSAIVGTGQWVEAAEFGIPAHFIAPHGHYSLVNEEEGFGPILPPGKGVMHSGTQEIHMVEQAGDEIAAQFDGILVAFLP